MSDVDQMDYGPRLSGPTAFNTKSKERFMRGRFRELVDHLGRKPSVTERILIQRICALMWMLLKFDERIDEEGLGEVSGHAQRAYLAAENRLRLDLQAIGLAPPKPSEPRWQDVMADIAAQNASRAAVDEATAVDELGDVR